MGFRSFLCCRADSDKGEKGKKNSTAGLSSLSLARSVSASIRIMRRGFLQSKSKLSSQFSPKSKSVRGQGLVCSAAANSTEKESLSPISPAVELSLSPSTSSLDQCNRLMLQDSLRSAIDRSLTKPLADGCEDTSQTDACRANTQSKTSNSCEPKNLQHTQGKGRRESEEVEQMQRMSASMFKSEQRSDLLKEQIGGDEKSRYSFDGYSRTEELKRMSQVKFKQSSRWTEEEIGVQEMIGYERFGLQEPRFSDGGSSRDSIGELRRVIKESPIQQNLPSRSPKDERTCRSNRYERFNYTSWVSATPQPKAKGLNLIANLMVLEEVPMQKIEPVKHEVKKKTTNEPRPAIDIDRPKAKKLQLVDKKKASPKQKSLQEINTAIQFKGLFKGMFDIITDMLQSEETELISTGTKFLILFLNEDPNLLRSYVIQQEGNSLLRLLVNGMITDFGAEMHCQFLEIIRILVNSHTMSGSQSDMFIGIFYERHLDQLIDVIASSCPPKNRSLTIRKPSSSGVRDQSLAATKPEILSNICELLCFCVLHHPYRIKCNFLSNNAIEKVLCLTRRREKFLVVAAVRFMRTIISRNDEHLIRHTVENNLLKPVIEVFVENGNRYNMLHSGVLELLEYICKENLKSLIVYVVNSFWDQLLKFEHLGTIRGLKLKYDQI